MKKVNPFLRSDELAKLLALPASGESIARAYLKSLSPQQLKELLIMKPGGQQAIPLIAKLVAEFGLSLNDASTEEMQQAAASAAGLVEVLAELAKLSKSLDDIRRSDESVAWGTAVLFYSLLNRISEHNPKLAEALKPINALFERRSETVLEQRALARAARETEKARTKAEKAQAKEEARKAAQAKKLAKRSAKVSAAPAARSEAPQGNVDAPSPAAPAPQAKAQ